MTFMAHPADEACAVPTRRRRRQAGGAGLTAALVIGDARWNLAGRNLAIQRDGGTEKIRLDDAAAVVNILSDRFGINVADVGGCSVLEGRIDKILDT